MSVVGPTHIPKLAPSHLPAEGAMQSAGAAPVTWTGGGGTARGVAQNNAGTDAAVFSSSAATRGRNVASTALPNGAAQSSLPRSDKMRSRTAPGTPARNSSPSAAPTEHREGTTVGSTAHASKLCVTSSSASPTQKVNVYIPAAHSQNRAQ
jgi:hypothetical protein